MRDVRNFTVPEYRHYTGFGSSQRQNHTRMSVKTFRSDIVPTIPYADGTYHRVTSYDAYHLLTSPRADETKWYWRNIPNSGCILRWSSPEIPQSTWNHGCGASFRPSLPGNIISRCRSSMDAQVRDGLDISQFAGEARQTASLLADVLLSVIKAMRKLRSASLDPLEFGKGLATTVQDLRKNGGGLRKEAAKLYLKTIYGIMPFVSDVQRITSEWDRLTTAPISKPLYVEILDSSFLPTRTNTRWMEGHVSRGISSGAAAVVLDPGRLRAGQYGLHSPLSLAWELTTLSFVVDWFTGIGSFIRALEPPFGVAIVDYWETQWVDNNFKWVVDYYSELYKNGFTEVYPGEHHYAEAQVVLKASSRTTANHILPPPPFLSLGVNASQVVSLVALLVALKK